QYDTRAIASLDAMSETIGELSACSYTLNSVTVTVDDEGYYNEHDVYMRGPDKMYIHSVGSKGTRSYWYDGETMTYFSFDKNLYASVEAPDNIIETIDAINVKYSVDFPAADFFYPSLTDDILDEYDFVLYSGDEIVNGIESTSVFASNDTSILRIWIDKASNFPLKMSIESKDNTSEYYEATFSNFKENPILPDFLFASKPPANAERTDFNSIK
ncbi:MAG: DUF2092 domain-containing protein, partial [Proteobacteria bacterium]|nr:DUF2092 domain-containing protein [Pseudomonadota bacterium]